MALCKFSFLVRVVNEINSEKGDAERRPERPEAGGWRSEEEEEAEADDNGANMFSVVKYLARLFGSHFCSSAHGQNSTAHNPRVGITALPVVSGRYGGPATRNHGKGQCRSTLGVQCARKHRFIIGS